MSLSSKILTYFVMLLFDPTSTVVLFSGIFAQNH